MKRFATIVLLSVCLVTAGGCNDQTSTIKSTISQLQQAMETTQAHYDAADQALQALNATAETLPDGSVKDVVLKLAMQAQEAKAKAENLIEEYKPALAQLNDVLQQQDDSNLGDLIAAALNSAAPFVPPPYGAMLSLGAVLAGGIAGFFRGKQSGDANGVNIATAIEAAKDPNGVVNFSDPHVVATIDKVMTAAAKTVVDRAQKR